MAAVIPIAPNLPGTKAGETLPGAGAFTPDQYTTQAAAIEREWSRVIAMQLFRPEDKVERYNTVWNMANALRSKLDIRHPAFQQMTNLQQRINETLRVLGMTTKSVVVKPPVPSLPPPGVKPLIITGPVIGTKPLPDETAAPGVPAGSILVGKQANGLRYWRAPNGDMYDEVSGAAGNFFAVKRQVFKPAISPGGVTPVVVVSPPVPGLPPPDSGVSPLVDTTTPITAGFDFGKLLKPPMLYFVIGAAAFLLLGKK
jgi:hypothetical protein